MKTKILIALIAITCIAAFFGCKKGALVEKPQLEQNIDYNKSKNWFAAQINKLTEGFISNTDLRTGIPVWEKTKHYPQAGLFVTPMKIGDKNTDEQNTVYKFLLTSENLEGEITVGNYLYLVPDKNKGQEAHQIIQSLDADFFSFKKIPNDFSGIIIKYDIVYNVEFSKHFWKGQIINKKEKLVKGKTGVYKDMNSTPISSVVFLPCGQCESYYLITYDEETGEIISIEYLYTECGDCPTGEGGNNGGNGNSGGYPTCEMSATERDAALNAITYATTSTGTSLLGTPGAPDANGIIRAPRPSSGGGFTLYILPGYSPHWEASYGGIVHKNNPTDIWKWESLTYSAFPQTAGSLPPCVSANMTASGVSTVISSDSLHATGAGNYSCNVHWSCITGSTIKTFSGIFSCTFASNTGVAD